MQPLETMRCGFVVKIFSKCLFFKKNMPPTCILGARFTDVLCAQRPLQGFSLSLLVFRVSPLSHLSTRLVRGPLSQRRHLLADGQRHEALPLHQPVHRTPVRAGQVSVLWNGEVSDVCVGRSHVQVGAALLVIAVALESPTLSSGPETVIERYNNIVRVFVCAAAPMATSSPAASPAWTTALTDSARSTRARCFLSAGKTSPQ